MCCLCNKKEVSRNRESQNSKIKQIIASNISDHIKQGLDLSQISILSILTDEYSDIPREEQTPSNINTPNYIKPNGLNTKHNDQFVNNSQDLIFSNNLENIDLEKLVKQLFDENQNSPNEFESLISEKKYLQEGFHNYVLIRFKVASKAYQIHAYKMQQAENYFNELNKFNQLKQKVEAKFQTIKA
ncbi:hypothetical protein ABPG72_019102 [Tetrahymena utriculariae]